MSLYHDRADDFFRQYQSVAAEKVHASWLAVLDAMPAGHALDVGAGSGRDARYLAERGWSVVAVEPADALRERAMQLPVAGVTWLADSLPELGAVYRLQIKFDLIVLSAVWMHIAPSARARALRKLAGLLKPGGKLIVTLRHGEFADGRTAYPVSFAELKQLADQQALQATLLNEPQPDELGRPEITWQTVLLTLPDDGSGAFSLLRHIVINDNKASSYKLGLLRALVRIAEGHPGAVLEQTGLTQTGSRNDQQIVLPLGLVAFYWLKLYRPLTENFQLFQNSDANKGLGFIKADGWQALRGLANSDFIIGSYWQGEPAAALHKTLQHIAKTIRDMPAKYIKIPGSSDCLFEVEVARTTRKPEFRLDQTFFAEFGKFVVPKAVWDNLCRFSVWIEPTLVNEWMQLMSSWQANHGRCKLDMLSALNFADPERSTTRVRNRVLQLQTKMPVPCVWCGQTLKQHRFAIDHAFPFSRWPNNDLWNLLPTTESCNNSKSDRLPSANLLLQSRSLITEWWQHAWSSHHDEFFSQAALALPQLNSKASNFHDVFDAMSLQRARLKHLQQLREWQLGV